MKENEKEWEIGIVYVLVFVCVSERVSERERMRENEWEWERVRGSERVWERYRVWERDRQREIDKEREKDNDRERQRDRQRERQSIWLSCNGPTDDCSDGSKEFLQSDISFLVLDDRDGRPVHEAHGGRLQDVEDQPDEEVMQKQISSRNLMSHSIVVKVWKRIHRTIERLAGLLKHIFRESRIKFAAVLWGTSYVSKRL